MEDGRIADPEATRMARRDDRDHGTADGKSH